MTETEKQVKRSKRMAEAKSNHWTEVRKLETQLNSKMKRDVDAEADLLKRCKEALYKQLQDKHTCDCCSVEYPDSFNFTEKGEFWYRFYADHPNDIRDYEVSIESLLENTDG